jgi:hypothetical protein
MTAFLDADQVRLELDVERVMDHYGLRGVKRGGWYRLSQCPKCHRTSAREAIAIEASSGRWLHHGRERNAGGECSGDLFSLVAACEGLDPRRDFSRIVQRAAEIAGIAEIGPDAEARITERLRERKLEEAREFARRQAAARDAAQYWDALSPRSDVGEVYLVRRGLDPIELIRAGACRFNSAGDVCVAIRAISGRVTTVATRLVDPGERPKVMVCRGTSTAGTMIDAIESVSHDRDVVLVEGVMDALTARLAWPRATILGANGAGNLAKIVRAAIGRIRLARTRLFLVPHDDEPGIRAMTAAGHVAQGGGLELDRSLIVVGLPAKDLNAAWCAGWRPEGFIG